MDTHSIVQYCRDSVHDARVDDQHSPQRRNGVVWTTPFSVVGLTRVPLGVPGMDGHDLRQFHIFRLIGRYHIEELHGTHSEIHCIIASYHDDL